MSTSTKRGNYRIGHWDPGQRTPRGVSSESVVCLLACCCSCNYMHTNRRRSMYEILECPVCHDQMSNNTGPIPADPFLLSIPARLDGTAFLGIIVERTRQYRVTLRVAIFGRRPITRLIPTDSWTDKSERWESPIPQ